MSSRLSDTDLILESMGGLEEGNNLHNDIIGSERGKSYYEAKALNILKQFNSYDEDYFYFLKTILGNYSLLSKDRQDELKKYLNIGSEDPKIIYKEKIVYKEKYAKGKKPKLNVDDY